MTNKPFKPNRTEFEKVSEDVKKRYIKRKAEEKESKQIVDDALNTNRKKEFLDYLDWYEEYREDDPTIIEYATLNKILKDT